MVLGFVIVRHVNCKETNAYWQEAYTCIRKWWDNPILIVDDHSNPEFLRVDFELVNCQVVQSEYPKVAELLGYYYFHKLRPFDTAVVIHDSVFIKQKVDFEAITVCAFLWSFTHNWDLDHLALNLISKLNQADEAATMYRNKTAWTGCFGVMSVIAWDFLDRVNTKYALFASLIPAIKDREDRMQLERVFAAVCAAEVPGPIPSILGNIHQYCQWGRTYANYKRNENSHLPIIKIWTGR